MVNAILLGNEIKMPYNIDAAALLGLGNELGQHRIIGARERQNVAVKALVQHLPEVVCRTVKRIEYMRRRVSEMVNTADNIFIGARSTCEK